MPWRSLVAIILQGRLVGVTKLRKKREHHDKVLKAYQASYTKYRTKLLDWIAKNVQIKVEAKQNFANTDYTFKLYNQACTGEPRVPPKSPSSPISTSPVSSRKEGRFCSWAWRHSFCATWPSNPTEFFIAFEIRTPNSQK